MDLDEYPFKVIAEDGVTVYAKTVRSAGAICRAMWREGVDSEIVVNEPKTEKTNG